MFPFPGGYPEASFDNFYVERGLKLASGASPGNFNEEGRQLEGRGWDMFSWHIEDASHWRPKARVDEGTNILDWWRSILKRLAEAS